MPCLRIRAGPSRLLVLLPLSSLLAQQPRPAPIAPVRPVIDEYFGQKVVDPYRWMENDKSPELLAWMKAQAATPAPLSTGCPAWSG